MLLPLLLTLSASSEIDFFIGTYTSTDGSHGIYHARLNEKTGEISAPELSIGAESPSYLALHPNGKTLYAVHEAQKGEVSAYSIGKDKQLTFLNTRESSGDGPCFLSVDAKGKNVLTASYGFGAIACLPIAKDGSLSELSQMVQNAGSGPNKARQGEPHLHSIHADPKSKFVYACDLGTDEVLIYKYLPDEGHLYPGDPKSVKVPAGGGPRHFAFGKKGKIAYVNNELIPSVTVFSVDDKTGALTELQTISTLPDGEEIGRKSTAQIVVHPNGKWLYVSNRNHDSIAVFKIQKEGTLEKIEVVSAGVGEPRGFEIDPSGHWLVSAGQNSNDLTSLAIDPSTGKLQPSGFRVKIDKPVCIVFSR